MGQCNTVGPCNASGDAVLLPDGPMTVMTIKPKQAGTVVEIPNPNDRGSKISVNVPRGAKPGQTMAVPLPLQKAALEAQQEKQGKSYKTGKGKGYSTGEKVILGAAGATAVAGIAAGAVVVGDHFTGGSLGAADMAADAAGTVGDVVGRAVENAGEAALTVADRAPSMLSDAGQWIDGARQDAGEWIEGAGEQVGDWSENAGYMIMDLF
jgi:hypothetical protein